MCTFFWLKKKCKLDPRLKRHSRVNPQWITNLKQGIKIIKLEQQTYKEIGGWPRSSLRKFLANSIYDLWLEKNILLKGLNH